MTNPWPASAGEPDRGLWTFPNLISALRIGAIPVFLWLLIGQDDPRSAALLLIVIGVTDFLDGAIARRLGQTSEIGKLLDPTADRLAILAALLGGLIAEAVPAWIAWPLLVREVLVGGGTVLVLLITKLADKPPVRLAGKLATAIVYASIPAYYLAAAQVSLAFATPRFWESLGAVTGIAGLLFYWVVTFQYWGDLRKVLRTARQARKS